MFKKFYQHAYVNGMVNEEEYELNNIPIDYNFKGETVFRDMNISLENRQRAKMLSSEAQIDAWNAMISNRRQMHYQKLLSLYYEEFSDTNNVAQQKMITNFFTHTSQNLLMEYLFHDFSFFTF